MAIISEYYDADTTRAVVSIAICIVGTIGAGKSAIGSHIASSLNLPFLTETMFDNGLNGILDRMSEYECVVVEHCELLKHMVQIERRFSNVVVIHIDISNGLARLHKEERIKKGATGDFLKIDPIAMKKEIERFVPVISARHTYLRVYIESDSDYEPVIARLTDELMTYVTGNEKT